MKQLLFQEFKEDIVRLIIDFSFRRSAPEVICRYRDWSLERSSDKRCWV